MYVTLDGFDLGVGILFPFAPNDASRGRMVSSVIPVWDSNETWLVLGGGGLLATFPHAYSIILPAVYIPISLMLIALVFRGVAFEFRAKAVGSRKWWDRALFLGSLVAALCQGFVLGAFVQGFQVDGRDFAGAPFDWLTPFSVLTAGSVAAGYALLGCGWLIFKTDGPLRDWSYRIVRGLFAIVLGCIVAVSIWTLQLDPSITVRWFRFPDILYLSLVPLATGALLLTLFWAVVKRRDPVPFLCGIGLFALCYLGLGISLWPYAVPFRLTIWDAAAAPASLAFMIVGTAIVVPLILIYTAFSYWIFRGKITGDTQYH
jgi:cytochrome d ubiquinol oxidase subunit II